MRRAARVDGNHGAVVSALRKMGAWVFSTAALGNGFPDLLACLRGRFVLLEVKDEKQSPSKRKLTEAEEAFCANCPGPVYVVNSPVEAVAAVSIATSDAREIAGNGAPSEVLTSSQGPAGVYVPKRKVRPF